MKVALFGSSGKIGLRSLALLQERGAQVRALIHSTPLPADLAGQVETVKGSITDPAAVMETVEGADVVLHMATAKEDPHTFFDVSVKGTFHVLEACRHHRPQQLILLGGDASKGIWFYPHPEPIKESDPDRAYPGYYAFSKVVEETMLRQYHFQYGLNYTILRSSWVFEKDDLLNHFSLLKNVDPREKGHGFGEVPDDVVRLVEAGKEHLPVLIDATGAPLRRHIVHMDDVMQALDRMMGNPLAYNEDFNISGPESFDYQGAADCLSGLTGLPQVKIPCPNFHGFAIDINKARRILGYTPLNTFEKMAEAALAWRAAHA